MNYYVFFEYVINILKLNMNNLALIYRDLPVFLATKKPQR